MQIAVWQVNVPELLIAGGEGERSCTFLQIQHQEGTKRFSFLPEVTQEVEECTGERREAWVGVSGERFRGGVVR